MSARSLGLDDALHRYVVAHGTAEPAVLAACRDLTAKRSDARMQISPEQGQFLTLLVELMGARRILEVGVFTGYSSTAMALALPDDGALVACDISESKTAIAQDFWTQAGVRDKIDLRIGPATDTLSNMVHAGQEGSFDLAFVDADKESYPTYIELCHALLRRGGVLALDNVLWGGSVAKPDDRRETTVAIRQANDLLAADDRFTVSMLPLGDGLTLARKR